MNYTISNIRYEAMEEDDAIVYFHFDIIFTEPEPLSTKTFYPFSFLLKHIKQAHPEFYTYISAVREGLDGWGPVELETIEALGDEAIGLLYCYLEEYIFSCDWMESFFNQQLEWSKQSAIRQIDTIERTKDVLEKWENAAAGMFSEQKRYRQFCRSVEKEALRIAVEIYPELLEANQKQMKDFKYVFTNGIMKMHDDLSKHIDEIK